MDLKTKAATPKLGGSKKRGPNRLLYAGEVAASDLLPLDHILSVMRDPNASTKQRLAMATRALPYCHARLKSVNPPRQDTAAEVPTEINIRFVNPDGSISPPASTASDSLEAPIAGRSSS
jgi:hypothetical protein